MGIKAPTKESLVQISDKVRVEWGAARKKGKATKELLSDAVTASHYKLGAKDALGNTIVEGQQMDYLDWKSEYVWYLYELRQMDEPLHPNTRFDIEAKGDAMSREERLWLKTGAIPVERYVIVDSFKDRDEAIARGKELAKALASVS